jgi:hypothetical protein
MSSDSVQLTKTDIDTILNTIKERVSVHLGKSFIVWSNMYGASCITYNEYFISFYHPKGYFNNTEIEPGCLSLQTVMRNNLDLLNGTDIMYMKVNMENYNDVIDKIIKLL